MSDKNEITTSPTRMTMTVPGCSKWTEEEWQKIAYGIGATLGPRPEEWDEED